ncbi:hypothetical protein Drorol1_Dr00026870 [Drosera rotundifolia]
MRRQVVAGRLSDKERKKEASREFGKKERKRVVVFDPDCSKGGDGLVYTKVLPRDILTIDLQLRQADQASTSWTPGVDTEESLKGENMTDSDAESDDNVPQKNEAMAEADDDNDDVDIPKSEEILKPPA